MAKLLLNLKHMLLDSNVRYSDKINQLANAWNFIKQKWDRLDQNQNVQEDTSILIRTSIQLLLRADWKSISPAAKNHLKMQVSGCVQSLKLKKNESLAAQCHSILQMFDDPWGDPVLKNIFQDKPVDDAAGLKFLESDRHILRIRLDTLCEQKKCFELAQKLAAAVWQFYKRDRNALSFLVEDDLHYILCLHLILLVRQNKPNYIITQMQGLPMQQSAQFIKRLKHHHYPSDKNKLWKKSRKALEFVVQLLATRAIREPLEVVRGTLNDLMTEWVEIFCLDPEFEDMIGKLASLSISVDHLFALTNALERKCHGKHRLKCIEFFIKRLTSEVNQMNDLRNLGNEAQLRAAEEHLSIGFLQLGDLLSDSTKYSRECVLTAFSLDPTTECLQRLQDLAVQSGMVKKEVLDTGQPAEQPICAINESSNVPMEVKVEEEIVPMEIKVEDEIVPMEVSAVDGNESAPINLQLPESLEDDLNVVLISPRNRTLNWQLDWPDLKKRCEEHVQEMMKGERPAMRELKFLEIDYSKYTHMRSDDENHDGIEKGYEIDSSTADEDCDEFGGSNHRYQDTDSDPSYTIKKKLKPSDPMDPRMKKSKIPRTPKSNHVSPEESRSKSTISEMLLNKKKGQRKPKGKTPKSDAKRSRKSSVTQFQVSSGNLVPTSGSNYPCNNPFSPHFTPAEEFKKFLGQKQPRDKANLELLRKYRPKKPMGGPDQALHMLPKIGPGHSAMLPGLTSLDMMVPRAQSTTVQVVHVSGNAPPRTASSTITRPEDGSTAAASSEQVNGKPPQAQAQAGSSGSQSQASQAAAAYFNQGLGGLGPQGRVTVQLMPGSAPGLAPLTNSRTLVRPGAGPTQAPRVYSQGATTTALPQFATAFGNNAAGSSALKQALLAPAQQQDKQASKLNNPSSAAAAATQTAAGFGSHTQPAGFGAPAHPPGFGTATQASPLQATPKATPRATARATPLPPLQAVQARPTPPSPTSLQPQPAPRAQQPDPSALQQTTTFAVTGPPPAAPPPPPLPPPPAGTQAAACTTTPTTAQVIVTTSTGAIMTPTPPPGLLLVASTTAAPTATPCPSPSTASSPTSSTTSTSTATGLATARSAATATSTKAPTAAVLVAGLTQPHRPPATSGPVPTLVQRTFSAASLDKAGLSRGATVQIVQAVSQASQAGQAVKLAVVPALVQSASQHGPLASVVAPPGVAVVPVAKRGIGIGLTSGPRTRVSNPILGKYLKEQGDAAATTAAATATPTTPPGAAAAAAAATAAARAEAANAPSNVTRPLYASSTPTSATDILKEQLLEFESVLHHVHTTRQLKERQSLEDDPKQPQQQQPQQPASTAAAGAAPVPTPTTTPAATPTQPSPAPTRTPPLAAVAAVAAVTTSTATSPTTTVHSVLSDASVQAGSALQLPRSQTAQATTQTSQTQTPTVVHTIRAVPVSMAVPVSTMLSPKSVIPVTVSVATVSSVASSLPPTVTLGAPKKKPKLGKTLTVVAAPGTTVVTAPLVVSAPPPAVPSAPPVPPAAPAPPGPPAPPTPTVTTQPEHRQFKPNIISTLSTAKHIGQKSAEDEQMTARIMSILKQYDEQLRCSPEINNKPAPRRRNQVQPGAASSPTNKRKHKTSKKGSVSELSPGTDDTHTMGSEDSSIASHFADGVMDGVMEATPTSPLSTCDERSLASTVAATATTATTSSDATVTIAVTSFAGVTKATTTTTESSDAAAEAALKTSPLKGPTMIKVQTPPKVQVLAKVPQLTPQSMPQPLTKSPAPVAVSSPIILPVALSIPTSSKSGSPPKIVTTTAGKIQMLAKVPTTQTPPSLLKTTSLPKVRPLVKAQSLPKVQQLAPLVMLSPSKPGESLLASNQGVVVQTSKESQIFTVSSRVIQSVESHKPSENPVTETAPPPQATEQVLQLAPASNQVSQLERALQSKPVSQTPLLARALKTPTTHLPTTFTGILSTTTRLSIAQPSSTVQLRALPKVSEGEFLTGDRMKLQRSDMPLSVSQLGQTVQIVNVKTEELSPKSSQPSKLSQSPQSSSVSAVLHQVQVVPLQPETSHSNQVAECMSSCTSTTATASIMTQQVPTTPVVLLPATSAESQLPSKVEPSQCDSDLLSQSHQQSNGSLLLLTSAQPENAPTTDVLSGTSLVQIASQQPPPSDTALQEPLLQVQKTQQGVEDVLQVPQSSAQISVSPVQLAPPPLQMQQPTQIVKTLMQEQLTSQAVQQIQLAPQGMATSSGQSVEGQLSSRASHQETQADLVQPALQMEATSHVGLQSMSQTQLTSPISQSMQQILEPLPQVQMNSQIVHSLTQDQILQSGSQLQPNTQILQITSQAPATSTIVQTVSQVSPISQIVIPTSQILQTTSQAQLVETAQMSQIMSSAPQLVQSLPQLVHSSKSSQPAQQRFGIQPVQLSTSSPGQIRRIVHQAQVSGDCTPQLVQISQPQLLQTQQLHSPPQLLMPPSSQAVAVSLGGTYTTQKPIEADEVKVTSPSKQNIVPLYMVPSSSASQLPVMISSATGMVHVNLVNSQAGPVVVRQVSKQDGKLTRDSSHDIISVISCDSSQPLLLSSIQQLFSGNAPVVSTSHLGAAMTTQTTATVVASSAPMFSVANVVDSAVVTDTSVLTLNSAPVTSEIPVNVNSLISNSVSSAGQLFQPLTTTNQTVSSAPILEAPAPVSQVTPRAVTPSTASSMPPLTNTSPSSAPNRPTTLLALQMQQRSKQLRQQEEEEKQLEMQQKIQQLRRLTQQHQQHQQPQQLAAQTDATPQPIAMQEISQMAQLESPTQPQPGLPSTTQVAVLLTQREASKSPQKQPTRINVSPQKVKDEALEKFPVIIPRTKSRPTLLSSPPQYKTTEPKHLRHLLDTPPAPLPPLYQTGVRRLSNPIKLSVPPIRKEDPTKVENHQEKQEVKPDVTTDSTVCAVQKNAEPKNVASQPSGDNNVPVLSPLKQSSTSSVLPDKLPGSTEDLPMPQPSEEVLSASLPETPPPDSSLEKMSTLSAEKEPGSLTPEKLQLPVPSPIRRLSFESSNDKNYLTPEKQMSTSLSILSTEKGTPLSSPQKISTTTVSESPSPTLVPLKLLPATSPEKQLLQSPKSTKSSPESSSKSSSPKGKKSPKIYAVTKTISKQTSPLKTPQKLASTKSQQLTSNMKAMVLTHSGLEALTSISDAVVLGQSENQTETETLFIRANVPQQSPSKGTDGGPTPDVSAGCTTPGSVRAKGGEPNYQRLIELPEGTRRPQSQLPKLNLLTKLTGSQPSGQTVPQVPVSEAPPLVPMSATKPVEPPAPAHKSFQLIDDTSATSKGLLSELPAHLCLDSKPLSSPEVRVYPPSQGSMDSDKVCTKPKLPTVIPVSAPPLLLSSNSSPAKATATVQVSYSALKSSGLKIQTPTQACVPSLMTIPLQVPKPVSAKAQAVTHERTLLSPDTCVKLPAAPPATVHQSTSSLSSTSKGTQEDTSGNVTPRPKRQRNRKRNSPRPQEKDSTSQSSNVEPELKSQQLLQKKNGDSDASITKRTPKKKDNTGAAPVTPEIVSQHLSDTIMRVSLGVDEAESKANEEISPPLVKDVYEDQEKIPVEVAVAALCGEDIENAKDLLEGNLQGDMEASGAITLLPADPSESTEELNFFRNVVENISDENAKAGLHNACSETVDSMSLSDNKDHSVISAITNCTDASDIDLSIVKEESSLVPENKDDETVHSRVSQKRKATGSHSGSFSEHSRSLSGSDDLSMDKTSTSDIFPETDILFETTLSPSFLGEIAQLSPSNSQDAVCASPEPLEKRKRTLTMKTLPKQELDETKSENKALSSIGSLTQFNGGDSRSEMDIGDSFKHTVIKQECSFEDSTMLDNPVANILDDQATMPKSNQTLTSLAGTSAFFSSIKSGSSGDEASWEKEPLFANQTSDNEEEPFWSEALTSGVDIDLCQEGNTNSSSTPSETLSKTVKASGRGSSQRSLVPQTRKTGVKRKDESANSPSQKQLGEKRKRVSSLTSNEEEEGNSKYGQVLRSSVTKPSRRDGIRGAPSKEDTIQRRVSTRTPKPVTRFIDPQNKAKTTQNKQPPKTVTNKKK